MELELGYVNRRRWSWTEKRQQQADDVIVSVNALIEYHLRSSRRYRPQDWPSPPWAR